MAQVVNPRLRAEAVLDGILDLQQLRGRMAKVTVDDVMLLLALVDQALASDPLSDEIATVLAEHPEWSSTERAAATAMLRFVNPSDDPAEASRRAAAWGGFEHGRQFERRWGSGRAEA